MKNLTNRFISFMLVFALALSLSAPAFAAEYSSTDELNNEVGTIDTLEEIDFFEVEQEETSEDVLREIYANLAPEAKEKALQVIASDPDLLSYYIEEIDPTFSADQVVCGSNGIFRVGAQANDPTKNIERRLTTLGVPSAVILAAVAAATSLVYAAADGPLPFGDAYALFQTAKFAIVLAQNWKVVAPLIGTIIIIFKDEIGNTVNDIVKVLNQVKQDAQKEVDAKNKIDIKRINWNSGDKNHIMRGSKDSHVNGFRKLGLDPKDPKDWSKLLPFLKKAVELADRTNGPIDVNSGDPGKIVYYFKNFADKGVEICVKIFYPASGGAAKISDAWPVR